jgi:hypothetical protein
VPVCAAGRIGDAEQGPGGGIGLWKFEFESNLVVVGLQLKSARGIKVVISLSNNCARTSGLVSVTERPTVPRHHQP